ncbi:hypothetical protein DFH27DRAFT_612734 [Peziza echinospora]|nr:hypothetical protein DFH27DRAFT_612734 [Peziza echinospora]
MPRPQRIPPIAHTGTTTSTAPPPGPQPQPHTPYYVPTTPAKFSTLPPKTRILIGLGLIGYSAGGLLFSDAVEKVGGFTPSEEERERLRGVVPRVVVVEREERGEGGE